jgi:hypothetical protein
LSSGHDDVWGSESKAPPILIFGIGVRFMLRLGGGEAAEFSDVKIFDVFTIYI